MKHSFLDKYSDLDSFLHRLDPGTKIIALGSFILFVNLTKPTAFILFGVYGVLLAALIFLSKIPLAYIVKKSLMVLPFAVAIAAFIPFFKPGPEGLILFWNVSIKAYLSCLCMILLSGTTRFQDLLKGFEKLHCPTVIIMILSFMYRYVFVLTDELMRMERARESRSIGDNKWLKVKTLAGMVGVLFIRAYERGERVYCAMCSRGFDGRIRTLQDAYDKDRRA